jgi:1,5-anhydro-D-fructose reductase (1,5-anhydro-D-mannitol-forming)
MANLAFLGAAHIHTPNFVRMLGAQADHAVRLVWDHDGARATRTAAALGARATDDLAEALGDGIDAVIVCAETVRHEALVAAACGAGKHLFVEKPLGMSRSDAVRMQSAIEAAGVRFQTGYFMRGQPAHRFLKAEIARGTFGRISHVRHSNCHAGALRGWFDTEWRWMADPAQAGVGGFGDLGAHSVDLLVWQLGPVARVTAEIRTVTGRYGTCDELGEALLEFESGVIGSVAAGWVDVANPMTLLVSGTDGAAWVTGGQLFVACEPLGSDGKAPWTRLPPALPHPFEQFLDVLAGRPAECIGAGEAVHVNAVLEACYAAARNRSWERVDG